jgi:hypothetical protein
MSKCLYTVLFGVIILCLACGRQGLDIPSDIYSVTFVLDGGDATRATAAADEASIRDACLYFVNDRGIVVDAVAVNGNSVLRNFETGTYKAYYVANCGLTVHSFTTENEINSHVRSLASETGSFSMSASKSFSVPEDKTCSITAVRLVSKVEIDKISIDFSQYPDLAAQTFTIDSIFLINVAGESILADGTSFFPSSSSWVNKRGYVSSTSNALLCDAVGRRVTAASPYSSVHYFYCYQNNASTDSHSATWSVRYTRLVVSCTLGTRKTYYPIDITGPGNRLSRNCRYVISELVITDLGSTGPDNVITGPLPYHFSSEVKNWEGTYTISERF